jgi:hypothetical protein
MAESQSHAAMKSRYVVRESMKRHPGLDLGVRHTCEAFLDAAEFAIEFLDEHDPKREGRVSALEIVRESPEPSETVWRYEHDGSRLGPQDPREVWGFDANAWRGPDRAAYPA